MALINIASWNLQNLFDIDVSDIAADLEFTPEEGWDAEALDNKLTNLAEIIKLMHGGQGPDLLGICEVENKELLEELVVRTGLPNLVVAHKNSPDIRGIDTSLIYSNKVFALDGEPVDHNIHFRHPTRDVFEVPLRSRRESSAPMRRRAWYSSPMAGGPPMRWPSCTRCWA